MKICIKTPSRLHLGFMDLNGNLGRRYGSIGVSLSGPNIKISVQKNKYLAIHNANNSLCRRITTCVNTFAKKYHTDTNVSIRVHKKIPEHKGLGSGTQMDLAVAFALAHFHDIRTTPRELAGLMDRGKRSSIGLQSFERGGLIIDSGKELDRYGEPVQAPPQTLFRFDFPAQWKFVVIVPDEKQGLSGAQEKKAIGKLKPSKEISEKICRLVMMQMLPSFMAGDIEKFGHSLTELDYQTGFFFKSVQGGIYCEELSYKLIDHLIRSGAYGAGQSSWGPAIYGLTLHNEADILADSLKYFLKKNGIKGDVMVASVANHGADVEVVEAAGVVRKKSGISVGFDRDLNVAHGRPSSLKQCPTLDI